MDGRVGGLTSSASAPGGPSVLPSCTLPDPPLPIHPGPHARQPRSLLLPGGFEPEPVGRHRGGCRRRRTCMPTALHMHALIGLEQPFSAPRPLTPYCRLLSTPHAHAHVHAHSHKLSIHRLCHTHPPPPHSPTHNRSSPAARSTGWRRYSATFTSGWQPKTAPPSGPRAPRCAAGAPPPPAPPPHSVGVTPMLGAR